MNNLPTDFQLELQNYQLGLEKVLPDYLAGTYSDGAFVDELTAVLHSRDWLESVLAIAPRYARQYLPEIERLDQHLLMLKDKLLENAPFYLSLRQQSPRPRSHWWYYLDQIATYPLKPAQSSSAKFWLPLQ